MIEIHEVTATSYGGTQCGTVDFSIEVASDVTMEEVIKIAMERARRELEDSGYRSGPFDLWIEGNKV